MALARPDKHGATHRASLSDDAFEQLSTVVSSSLLGTCVHLGVTPTEDGARRWKGIAKARTHRKEIVDRFIQLFQAK